MRTLLVCSIALALIPGLAQAEDPPADTAEPTLDTAAPVVSPPEPPPTPVVARCDTEPMEGEICRGDGPKFHEPDYGYGIEIYADIDEQIRYVITPTNHACRHQWRGVEFEFIGLPEGATHAVSEADATAEIRWRPGRDDIGEHQATARVRARGHPWAETPVTILVTEEWETFFMPGVQYSLWLPESRGEYGIIQGVSIQYLVAAWIHRNENRGPSHGRFYVDIDLLRSTESPNLGIAYSFGLTLSFERNPKRQFLIPYFGAEVGGIYHKPKEGKNIHAAQVNPLGGLSIWASQNIFVNVTVGYLVPFSHLEQLRGLRVKAGLNFSFW
jgi:hypothetical protein